MLSTDTYTDIVKQYNHRTEETTLLDRFLRGFTARVLKTILVRPVLRLHPNAITAIALLPGTAAAVCAAQRHWCAAIALFMTNRVIDGVDGAVARMTGKQSDLGGYLDIMTDFLVYAALPIAIWIGADHPDAWATVCLLAAFYVNAASWMYLSALLEKRGRSDATVTSIAMPTGVIEGSETIAFFVAFLALPQLSYRLFVAMAVLTLLGAALRLVWAIRHL